MRVLVACEFSGIVREAFNSLHGVYATSCDLLPAEDGRSDYHYQGDVRDIINDGWDVMICHPECTYLCGSGLHWNKRRPERALLTEEAFEFAMFLMNSDIPRIAMENPVGLISTRYRKADQIIQPYDFGEDASKATCLWLKGLPVLKKTKYIEPRTVEINGKKYKRWSNQTDSGQNRLSPSEHRWADRSRTYPGIARAMADQWGAFLMERVN